MKIFKILIGSFLSLASVAFGLWRLLFCKAGNVPIMFLAAFFGLMLPFGILLILNAVKE